MYRYRGVQVYRCTFGVGGAQQGVAGDHHVQDRFGEVGVQVSHGGGEHHDVLSERLVRITQTAVHVADAVIRLQRERGGAG